MKARCKLWIVRDDGEAVFGDGRLRMLRAIEEFGSMNRAAKHLGMSYRTLWGKVHDTEKRLGARLVDTCSGGSAGSGTRLLPEARRLMKAYEALKTETVTFVDEACARLFDAAPKRRSRS